jgi:hypothetical protein
LLDEPVAGVHPEMIQKILGLLPWATTPSCAKCIYRREIAFPNRVENFLFWLFTGYFFLPVLPRQQSPGLAGICDPVSF